MADFKEKRKSTRFQAPFCLECRHPGQLKDLPGVIKDVSYSGACLLVDLQESLPAEKPLFLTLIFPQTTLNLKAKIIWQKKVGEKNKLGVSFFSLPDYFKEDIYQQIFKYYREQITNKWWNS